MFRRLLHTCGGGNKKGDGGWKPKSGGAGDEAAPDYIPHLCKVEDPALPVVGARKVGETSRGCWFRAGKHVRIGVVGARDRNNLIAKGG